MQIWLFNPILLVRGLVEALASDADNIARIVEICDEIKASTCLFVRESNLIAVLCMIPSLQFSLAASEIAFVLLLWVGRVKAMHF